MDPRCCCWFNVRPIAGARKSDVGVGGRLHAAGKFSSDWIGTALRDGARLCGGKLCPYFRGLEKMFQVACAVHDPQDKHFFVVELIEE